MDSSTLRTFIYDKLIVAGTMPSSADIATHFAVGRTDALRALSELKIGKTVLPHPRTGEIWMAGPFSAAETQYAVRAGERQWFANCAWDMLGVATLVDVPVDIETRCTDCGDPIALRLEPQDETVGVDLLVHFLLPARRWYDDIGFT
ncbi:MAG TPA: organomercurial lyase [Gemmatimonadaceae bacterium]|nr:organomercurial lyase [Gemmatimonadaceae bacterium]